MEYNKKCENLLNDIGNYVDNGVVIAFSGGIDSSLLLKLATLKSRKSKENAKPVYAVTVHTKLHPVSDVTIAKKVAKEMGAIHRVIYVDELAEVDIDNNPIDRCYRCKRHLFRELSKLKDELGAKYLIDGTNFDDLFQYRPGIKALKELGVISPLAKNEFTKSEIRDFAREYNISVANRPSAPCLATRFPYNTKISYEIMDKIENAEDFIRDLGFYNVRIRVHNDIARIEIDKNDISKFISLMDIVTEKMKSIGFTYVTLDLEGFRSGSMDIYVK